MYCTKCGKQIPDGSKFCKFCGEKTTHTIASLPKKSITEKAVDVVAWVICALIGCIAIFSIEDGLLAALFLGAASVVVSPVVRHGVGMKTWLSFVLCGALFFCGVMSYPTDDMQDLADNISDYSVSSMIDDMEG